MRLVGKREEGRTVVERDEMVGRKRRVRSRVRSREAVKSATR